MRPWKRFSSEALQVIVTSRGFARTFGSESIQTEHLLIAFCLEYPSLLSAISRSDDRAVSHDSESNLDAVGEVALADAAKRALAFAIEEAERQRLKLPPEQLSTTEFVMPLHVLLGLLRADERVRDFLQTYGVTFNRVEASLAKPVANSEDDTNSLRGE